MTGVSLIFISWKFPVSKGQLEWSVRVSHYRCQACNQGFAIKIFDSDGNDTLVCRFASHIQKILLVMHICHFQLSMMNESRHYTFLIRRAGIVRTFRLNYSVFFLKLGFSNKCFLVFTNVFSLHC